MRALRWAALGLGGTVVLLVVLVVLGARDSRHHVAAAPAGEPVSYQGDIVRLDLRFACGSDDCAGWLFLPDDVRPPVVIMAHGFAGTRDVALEPFALTFAEQGMAAFVFDYRCFGASGGAPRQLIDPWRQLEDWHAAIAFIRQRTDVDGSRLALWGSSLGAGHALVVAAQDAGVSAVVAQAPLVDTSMEGEAAELSAGTGLRLLFTAWADLVQANWSDDAVTIPAISRRGDVGLISDPAAYQAFEALVTDGSTYRNAVAARSILTFDDYNPTVQGAGLEVPALLIASRSDRFARFDAAEAYADAHPTARLAEIGGDHFDIYAPRYRVQAARLAATFLAAALIAEPRGR